MENVRRAEGDLGTGKELEHSEQMACKQRWDKPSDKDIVKWRKKIRDGERRIGMKLKG